MSIYLKKVNYEDIDKEYDAIINIPENENGLVNKYYNVTKDEFKNKVIPELLNHAEGIDLVPGHVPDTYFFLWDDNEIVGLFKIRHYLVESLIKGSGHIGYAILKKYRGKGYATAGLKVAIKICKDLIREDEIYLSSHKDNPASLKVQIKCGAYLTGENEEEYFTRIKLNNEKELHFGIRDLKRDDWSRITDKSVNVIDYKNEYFDGKICLLKMNNVSSPLEVDSPIGKVIIADNNYKNLIIAPKNKNWWLTVMYDDNDNLIESYFDISRLNNFYNEENPFFIDMKLDVCIPNGHDPSLMDEEDLKEVLNAKMITEDDYKMAYEVANKIINFYNTHKEEYNHFISKMFNELLK